MVFFLGSDQWLPHHIKRFEITLGSEIEYDRNLSILYFPLFRVHRNILVFFSFWSAIPNFYSLSLILVLRLHFLPPPFFRVIYRR